MLVSISPAKNETFCNIWLVKYVLLLAIQFKLIFETLYIIPCVVPCRMKVVNVGKLLFLFLNFQEPKHKKRLVFSLFFFLSTSFSATRLKPRNWTEVRLTQTLKRKHTHTHTQAEFESVKKKTKQFDQKKSIVEHRKMNMQWVQFERMREFS